LTTLRIIRAMGFAVRCGAANMSARIRAGTLRSSRQAAGWVGPLPSRMPEALDASRQSLLDNELQSATERATTPVGHQCSAPYPVIGVAAPQNTQTF